MTIVLNGDQRPLPVEIDLLSFVQSLGLDPERVAVELNRRIVKRADWPSTLVTAGAEIEVVMFVGGG